MRYYIFCDESISKGSVFSNFYGGLLINSNDFDDIKTELEHFANAHIKNGKIKWGKVNEHSLEGYFRLMDVVFGFINNGYIKIRIMYTQNIHKTDKLTEYHKNHEYHLLYYQFLKHAFGLKYLKNDSPVGMEIFLDNMPANKETNDKFKKMVYGIRFLPEFADSNIKYSKRDIQEIDSKNHILLQCLDVILGAMAFRLNKKHLEKAEGTNRRGKRTKAKEKLYKYILKNIRGIRPNFNIGISTGMEDMRSLWTDEYRHWLFKPKK